jgi:DNA-binding NtrC family response regulator
MLIDDDDWLLNFLRTVLQGDGIDNLILVNDSRAVMPTLENQEVGIIILDLRMPHISGEELLRSIKEKYPAMLVVVLTGVGDVTTAVDCMKAGAFDYLLKPVNVDKIISVIRRVIEYRDLREENRRLKESILTTTSDELTAFSRIITESPRIKALFRYIEAIAKTTFSVLIVGETGVGKELFAESIHLASNRKGAFVPVNIAGLDDQILNDTLFGHKKGAFSGASHDRTGLVLKARNGTLFLDEIGELRPESQIKLLRFLQERKFTPLGSDSEIFCDVRVIAATNRPINELQEDRSFRKDLYYRLQTHKIEIPPLRERPGDIPLLLEHFVQLAADQLGKKVPTLPQTLYGRLASYPFPGNVRELQAMVFDAISLCETNVLPAELIESHLGLNREHSDDLNNSSQIATKMMPPYSIHFPSELPSLDALELMLIQEALARTNGNKSLAARLIDMPRSTLISRLVPVRWQQKQ